MAETIKQGNSIPPEVNQSINSFFLGATNDDEIHEYINKL